MSKKLYIQRVERVTMDGVIEALDLKPGVNIIEGAPNSGKTVWLTIIDYLFGDSDQVENALGHEDEKNVPLYQIYRSVSMTLNIEGQLLILERRWHEAGMRGKIFFNGEPVGFENFSDRLLSELQIPRLKFPRGNPVGEKTWPHLSWRIMLRHMYRRELLWGDLADRQPVSEQYAVLAQFLGLAEKIYSKNFNEVVDKNRELLRLEAEREQFTSVLNSIGRTLSGPYNADKFITHESIDDAIKELENKIEELLKNRQTILSDELKIIEEQNRASQDFILAKTNERNGVVEQLKKNRVQQNGIIARIGELTGLQSSIRQEIIKLNRTKEAGNLFSDLKITNCPACDQTVKKS